MATTKIKAVHSHLGFLIEYVSDKDKTENPQYDDLFYELTYIEDELKTERKLYVDGINCTPETAIDIMNKSLAMSAKQIKVLAYHAIQSFSPGEVSAETAHEIGMKLATELWGDRFAVIVATHLNKAHFHNHFLVCSTSYLDGSRYHACKASYWELRNTNDRLCWEYGLSVPDGPLNRGKTYTERTAENQGKATLSSLMKEDIDFAVSRAMTMPQFYDAMENLGYELKHGKYLAIRGRGAERFRRTKTLGENYSEEAIFRRVRENIYRPTPFASNRAYVGQKRFHGTFRKHKRLSGMRALYYRYLYEMGILNKNNKASRHPSPLLREDIIKLDRLIEQNDFLHQYRIDTSAQLSVHKENAQKELMLLTKTKARLRDKLKHPQPDEIKNELRNQISNLTIQIKAYRKEIALCDAIEEQTAAMKEKLKTIAEIESAKKREQMEKQQRKVKNGARY